MKKAEKLRGLTAAVFSEMHQYKQRMMQEGRDIIDLGIGSPDLPPPGQVMEALAEAVQDPSHYAYPASEGTAELRHAIRAWYARRCQVDLDPEREVTVLMGSQDGLAHIATAFIDPGDTALVPDPGYPIYRVGILLAGGLPYAMPLREENSYLPDLEAIPEPVARRAKLMILNYPNNPLAAVAPREWFEEVVRFARKHDLLVVHDFAYSELAFDGFRPASFLEIPGAREIGVEFHSLSKSYNMAGCRIGFAVGNADAIEALRTVKSNIDYGVFTAIQKAGVAALTGNPDHTVRMAAVYQNRRDTFLKELQKAGWNIPVPKASMFLWARVPVPRMSSRQFAMALLQQAGVVVIPGDAFGTYGEGYVRMALVVPEDRLREAAKRIKATGILS
jgi:LL-diaminopimelate aminotransferase